MRRILLLAGAVALAVVAGCEDGVGPGKTGSIVVSFTTDRPATAVQAAGPDRLPPPQFAVMTHLEAATALVEGPTTKTADLTKTATGFTGKIDGLSAGTYRVVVIGLVGGRADHFAQVSNVTVQAGKETTANFSSFPSFRPALSDFPAARTTALTVGVSYSAVSAAQSYKLEWSKSSTFTGTVRDTTVTSTSVNVSLADGGTYHFRVRAVNQYVDTSGSRPSDAKSLEVVADTIGDTPATAFALGFAPRDTLTGLNILPATDEDWFKLTACKADTVGLDAVAANLTPPSKLNSALALFDGSGSALIASNNDAVGTDARIVSALPEDGTYAIQVVGFQNTVGHYELRVVTRRGPFNTGTACQRPDVQATSVSHLGSALAGELVQVTVQFDNTQTVALPGGWSARIVLSSDNVITTADQALVTWLERSKIPASGSLSHRVAVQLPDTLTPGTAFVGLIADVNNTLDETSEANNAVASATTLSISAAPFPTEGRLSSLNLHTCRLDNAGQAKCWGDNLDGELGDGTLDNVSSTPVTVQGGLSFTQIVTGQFHTCGLTAQLKVYCWGWNGDGQLGDPATKGTQVPTPTRVPTELQFVRLSAGWSHTCGIELTGAIYCWGQGSNGELGDGTFTSSTTPVQVANAGTGFWKDIAAGDGYTCAVSNNAADGTVYCWGYNNVGQLGNGTLNDAGTPVASTGTGLRDISIANWHACGVTTGGAAHCWGLGGAGQLGNGAFSGSPTKVLVSGGFIWKAVVAGGFHTCGVRSDSQVWCWGSGFFGTLGDGTLGINVSVPTNPVGVLANQLALGTHHSCVRKTDNSYVCWGSKGFGQLGDGSSLTNIPRVANITGVSRTAAGWEHSCAMKSATQDAWCWGFNGDGELGDGGASGAWSTTPVSTGLSGITYPVSALWAHTCAVKSALDVYCWGFNSNGQLGDGSTLNRSVPTLVNDLGLTFVEAAAGYWHSCGLTNTGEGYCWGYNGSGQLGNNTTTQAESPVGVQGGDPFKLPGSDTRLTTIATGQLHSCAIDPNNDVWCWGDNTFGQLGDGTTSGRLTPVLVPAGGKDFTMVTAGDNHTCAVASDATAWCWGLNDSGELGDNSSSNSSTTPVQVSGGISWAVLSAGNDGTCGISTAGTAYCWGYNFEGQLGDGTFWDASTPQAVQSTKTFTHINAGNRHVCAAASDGTVLCWGRNRFGQLGDGSVNVAITPTAVLPAVPRGAGRYYIPTSARRPFDRSKFGRDPDALRGSKGIAPGPR